MNKLQLQNFAEDISECEIKIVLQTHGGKWYEQEYTSNFTDIETDKVYGICVNGTGIDYVFKTGKKEDNILKSFVTQYISKYEIKRVVFINGFAGTRTKQDIYKKLKNSDRVEKYYFYTTLYGIGYFCLFMNKKTFENTNIKLSDYLKTKNIQFGNEFSEAGWVYRFVINKDVKIHNQLLNEFKI